MPQVPVLKFVSTFGDVHVDVTINNGGSGEGSTAFMHYFLTKYDPLRPLTLVLKRLLEQGACIHLFVISQGRREAQ